MNILLQGGPIKRSNTVFDWDNMCRFLKEAPDQAFQAFGLVSDFTLKPNKLDRVFEKLVHVFWNKIPKHLGSRSNLNIKI